MRELSWEDYKLITYAIMSRAEDIVKKYSKEELVKKFDALPKQLQDITTGQQVLDALRSIAQQNNMPDKFPKLRRYTMLVLSGIVPITLLRETLQEELQIDEERARKIAMEIRDKIFMQVKDELRKIHNLE